MNVKTVKVFQWDYQAVLGVDRLPESFETTGRNHCVASGLIFSPYLSVKVDAFEDFNLTLFTQLLLNENRNKPAHRSFPFSFLIFARFHINCLSQQEVLRQAMS